MKTLFNPRTALIIALALLCNTCAKEEIDVFGSISGTVRDVQQQPLEGVSVSLTPGGLAKSTGKNGSYVFIDLESKQYTLAYSKNEYLTVSKTTTVQAAMNNVIDVTLEKEQLVPVLAVSTKTLDFGTEKTTLSLEISNTGKGALSWAIAYSPGVWFTCSPSIGTIAAGGKSSVVVTASRSQKENGTYHESFAISSNGGNCDVEVAMTVGGVGLSIAPASLDFDAITTERQLTLTNTGATTIDYTVEASNDWIKLQKTSGKLTATDNLHATVYPDNASNKNVSWSTGNEAVATVNDNGTVTFVGAGETNITVRTQDGNKTATCYVRVTASIPDVSGTAGPLTWSLSNGVLTISGSGAIPNCEWEGTAEPWLDVRDYITTVYPKLSIRNTPVS
jgi:uncharacterized protein YjdB